MEVWSYHDHLDFGSLRSMMLNDVVKEDDFSELHSHVIFSPACKSKN